MKKIVIDAGHGGSDPGAVGQKKTKESNINLKLSKMLRTELEKANFEIIMTRDSDKTTPLGVRTNISNTHKADFFISIHCNSAGNKTAQGIETYIYTESKVSKKYAEKVQGEIIKAFPDHINRGIKEANFHVLRETICPAILIETEFISNAIQEDFLIRDVNLMIYAKAIKKAILSF